MYRHLLLTLLLAFTLSCAKSTIKIMPDYANKTFAVQKLAVIAVNSDIYIGNTIDLKDDLGEGKPEVIFTRLLKTLFPDKLKHYSRFENFLYVDSLSIPNPREIMVSISKEQELSVTIPGEGEKLKIDSLNPDVILFINKFTTDRKVTHNSGWRDGNGMRFGEGSSSSLQYKAVFVLWDNRMGKVVAQGESVGEDKVVGGMNYKTWNKAFNDVARNIMVKTPYYRPQTLPPPNSNMPNPLKVR